MMTTSLSGLDERDIADIVAHGRRVAAALRDARILVTGATGWFGTWLLDGLLALDRAYGLGLQIVAVSRDPRAFARRHPRLAGARAVVWFAGDVRDPSLAVGGPITHVIHAAAESSTTWSAASEATMTATIVDGTRHVLANARAAGARRFLFVSSGAVYGPQPPSVERLVESGPLDGTSPYATGKHEAENLVLQATGLAPVVARCFAFVGPNMPFDAHFAIGNFIRDASEGREIRITGDGKPRRSYLYMTDLVVWLLTILVEGRSGRAYNVGGSDAVTIRALAERCAAGAGVGSSVAVLGQRVGGHDYVPDVTRATSELDLVVNVSLDDAIARTARWRAKTSRTTGARVTR